MKPALKVAIVAGGYLLAILMAFAAVALHTALTGESGAQASDGMSAFGDLVLFVAVFGAVALLPTGAGLFFLLSKNKRPNQSSEPTASSGAPPAGQESRPRWVGSP
jgi:hypothetical protein